MGPVNCERRKKTNGEWALVSTLQPDLTRSTSGGRVARCLAFTKLALFEQRRLGEAPLGSLGPQEQ